MSHAVMYPAGQALGVVWEGWTHVWGLDLQPGRKSQITSSVVHWHWLPRRERGDTLQRRSRRWRRRARVERRALELGRIWGRAIYALGLAGHHEHCDLRDIFARKPCNCPGRP